MFILQSTFWMWTIKHYNIYQYSRLAIISTPWIMKWVTAIYGPFLKKNPDSCEKILKYLCSSSKDLLSYSVLPRHSCVVSTGSVSIEIIHFLKLWYTFAYHKPVIGDWILSRQLKMQPMNTFLDCCRPFNNTVLLL